MAVIDNLQMNVDLQKKELGREISHISEYMGVSAFHSI
jgi:hypothetical protein